jgi:hypothetical protein
MSTIPATTPSPPPGSPRAAAYPVTAPGPTDPRFTLGLVLDIGDLLARHGYPPLATGTDLLRFQQALFAAIYQHQEHP